MAQLQIWNNPCLAFEYRLQMDLNTGKAFYETNFIDGSKQKYKCFFLVRGATCKSIEFELARLNHWQSYYGHPDKIIIDGYHWSIQIEGSSSRKYKGDNGKPVDFEEFIMKIENLIQKPLNCDKGVCYG